MNQCVIKVVPYLQTADAHFLVVKDDALHTVRYGLQRKAFMQWFVCLDLVRLATVVNINITYIRTCMHTYIRTYVHTYTHTYLYIYFFVFIFIWCIHTCMLYRYIRIIYRYIVIPCIMCFTCIYIYIYTHTYTFIFTYIFIFTKLDVPMLPVSCLQPPVALVLSDVLFGGFLKWWYLQIIRNVAIIWSRNV